MAVASLDQKSCMVCGRAFSWRKKWARTWDEVRYCSRRCNERRLMPSDLRLEATIEHLLKSRAVGTTICPSEAARTVDPISWKRLMEAARMAARRLVVAGKIEIVQGSQVVDASTAKGPIRLRLKPRL